ncbi:MAG: glycosyltransferase [Candidatus Marinimicrobia bacterium]|nr:glycosyltransferase [Candidatus Neomarinimicrobiota bacterium]
MRNQSNFQTKLAQIEKKIKKRDFESALNLLESIYGQYNKDLHINLLVGEMHLSIGQYRESEKFFNRALKIDSDHYQALYGIGKVKFLSGKNDEALLFLKKAHRLSPNTYDICRDLAEVYRHKKDDYQAEQHLLRSCEISGFNDESLLFLLEFYSESGRLDKARELLKEKFPLETRNQALLFRKGTIEILDQDFHQALDTFTRILKIEHTHIDALYYRGFCYLNINDLDHARQDFQQCIKLDPTANDIHSILALTYTLEGKVSQSINIWKEFLPIFSRPAKEPKKQTIGTILPMKIIDSIDIKSKPEKMNISIVIPVFNEEESLVILHEKIKSVMESVDKSYEVIFIDDGSSDNSLKILENLSRENPNLSVLKFRRNYGQTAAFAAGFKYATGDIIITMDADLQNDPVDIPRLLQKMSEGYDLVSGWRKNRQDKKLTRKIPSKIANQIINKLIAGTGIQIHDFGCSLKAYKKAIVKRIRLYGEMHRFIPAYAAWLGIKVAEIPVTHHSRKFGQAKYGLERVWRVILDLITLRFYTGFRAHPLLFFGKFALTTMFLGSLLSVFLVVSYYLTGVGINSQTFLIFLLFTLLGGMQFIIVGVLSEIITRGFFEARNSDEYIVEEIITQGTDQ